MRTTRTKEGSCPTCGAKVDAVTRLEGDEKPQPGDFTICFYCRDIFKFSETLGLLSLEESDIADIPLDQMSRLQSILKGADR